MNILINLKSRILSEALCGIVRGEEGLSPYVPEALESGLKPDVIMVDGHNVTKKLSSQFPESKFLLVDTGLKTEDIHTLLLTYKIDGVLSTAADLATMKKALRVVNQGQLWLDNEMLKAVLHKAGAITRGGRNDKISQREHEILELIGQGYKNREIAARLHLSEQTVKVHLSRMFKKFNITSRSQLITLIMKNQLM